MKNRSLTSLFALITLSSLAGCVNESFDGTLKLTQSLPVTINGQNYSIPAGSYAGASVAGEDNIFSRAIGLTVPVKGGNVNVEIQAPSNLEIPAAGGTVKIPSATGKQPFDLTATFDEAQVTDGDEETYSQSCTYQTCVDTANGQDCTSWPGSETITDHPEETVQNVTAKITLPGKTTVIATYQGTSDTSATVVDNDSGCN